MKKLAKKRVLISLLVITIVSTAVLAMMYHFTTWFAVRTAELATYTEFKLGETSETVILYSNRTLQKVEIEWCYIDRKPGYKENRVLAETRVDGKAYEQIKRLIAVIQETPSDEIPFDLDPQLYYVLKIDGEVLCFSGTSQPKTTTVYELYEALYAQLNLA